MYFDPHSKIEITERQLPHWRQKNVTYFVTFRLADSIPQAKLRLWKLKRDEFLETHPHPLSDRDKAEFYQRFTKEMGALLDDGMGACIFRNKNTSEILASALMHFDGIRYELGNWVIMPNHVHVIVQPLPGYDLKEILQSWKSYSAKEINKRLGRTGRLWQDESYDQIVRNERHLYRIESYIKTNPEKADVKVHHASWL